MPVPLLPVVASRWTDAPVADRDTADAPAPSSTASPSLSGTRRIVSGMPVTPQTQASTRARSSIKNNAQEEKEAHPTVIAGSPSVSSLKAAFTIASQHAAPPSPRGKRAQSTFTSSTSSSSSTGISNGTTPLTASNGSSSNAQQQTRPASSSSSSLSSTATSASLSTTNYGAMAASAPRGRVATTLAARLITPPHALVFPHPPNPDSAAAAGHNKIDHEETVWATRATPFSLGKDHHRSNSSFSDITSGTLTLSPSGSLVNSTRSSTQPDPEYFDLELLGGDFALEQRQAVSFASTTPISHAIVNSSFSATTSAIPSSSSSINELFRLVRVCAAQTNIDKMVTTVEVQLKSLLNASAVRLFLVNKDPSSASSSSNSSISSSTCSLTHYSRSQPFHLHQNDSLLGACLITRQPICLNQPANDARYNSELDTIGERGTPCSLLTVVLDADPKPETASLSSSSTSASAQSTTSASANALSHPLHTSSSSSSLNGHCSREVIGIIQALRYREREHEPFNRRDVKLLSLAAELLGNVVKNSRSADRAEALVALTLNENKRSLALLDVAKALSSETSLDRIVSIIVRQVPELLDSDRCTLYFVDRERQELIVTKGASQGRAKSLVSWVYGQSHAPELPFAPGCNELRLPINSGLAGHAAMTGQTVNIVDAHQDPRFNSLMDKETGYRTRSLLCVPMIDGKGVIIGVVQAINKNPLYPRGFDLEDETLLKTFGAQAAVAVRNSQLFQKTSHALQQSDALLEVTRALSSQLKIDGLIAIICSKVTALLSSERCTVFIVDKERHELYTSASMSYGMGPALPIDHDKQTLISFPMDRGIAGAVATSGVAVNISDAYKDERFNQTMDKETGFRTRSILCMAIQNHRGQISGVLQVMNKAHDGTFSSDDEKMLGAFCAQAAVALENSHLFQQTEKALNHALADQRNLKFMLSVTKNLFSDLHLTSMIDQMSMQVHHLLKADDCVLYLVDEEKHEFWAAKEEDEGQVRKHSFDVGLVGFVARTAQSVRISTAASQDPRFNAQVDQRRGRVTHSLLCCPIKAEVQDSGAKVVGVMSVRDERDRGGFEVEEEKLLRVFCAQAAVAIMNSKRFSAIMEQSEVKESDHSAAEYLKMARGMKLASDDINSFQYRMDEIVLKGAIGTGSYGEVYRAQVRGQIVAVKKLHVRSLRAEQVDAFCKEASLMCQLDHRNIVGFIGAVTEPSHLCILTQYCSRGSLADLLLEASIQMNFTQKVQFALDAAQGMLYLHHSNPAILHRDLKSDNLLVTQDWTVKVADFGLTRFMSEKKQMTQVGTPMWMAPEIIMGKKYTEKADVYAFGIILWEILTREEPYEEKEPMQIVVEVVNDGLRPTIQDKYALSPLIPLMTDCWHTEATQRPTFEKVVERLQAIKALVPIDDESEYGTTAEYEARMRDQVRGADMQRINARSAATRRSDNVAAVDAASRSSI